MPRRVVGKILIDFQLGERELGVRCQALQRREEAAIGPGVKVPLIDVQQRRDLRGSNKHALFSFNYSL